MRRFLLIFLSLALALSALAVGVAWYLLHNETFLKSRLHSYILAQTGRELTVGQTLRLKIGRRLLVVAEDIRLQNAAWAGDPYMARIGHLRLVLDIPTLLADTTIVHSLRIEDCTIDLIETDAGATNWDDLMALGDDIEEEIVPAADEALPFLFRDNTIRNCRLTHRAPSREQPLSLEIEEFDLGLIDDIRWQGNGKGKLNGDALALSGWLEPAGVFINGGALEHDLDIEIGQVSLESQGTVQDVYSGQGADIRLRFQGPEIANVLGYFGLPPVSTGEFDFRLSLDSREQMTRLDVDGDLGTIQAQAEGEVDRLVDPTTGRLKWAALWESTGCPQAAMHWTRTLALNRAWSASLRSNWRCLPISWRSVAFWGPMQRVPARTWTSQPAQMSLASGWPPSVNRTEKSDPSH